MASLDSFTSSPEHPREAPLNIDALKDEILLQQTILTSLREIPTSSERQKLEAATLQEIRELNEQLARAKESYPSSHIPRHIARPFRLSETSTTPSRMSTPDQSSGPSWPSGPPYVPQQALPYGKRKFPNHLAAQPQDAPGRKSMKPTPSSSPMLAPFQSLPAGNSEDITFIDLTGEDDDDADISQQTRLDTFQRNHEMFKRDEAYAKQLAESTKFQGSSSQHDASADFGRVSAFDRIMGRSSQSRPSGELTQRSSQLVGYDHNAPGARPVSAGPTPTSHTPRASLPYQLNQPRPTPQSRFHIPGSYYSEEEYSSGLGYLGNTSRISPQTGYVTSSGVIQPPQPHVPMPASYGILGADAGSSFGAPTLSQPDPFGSTFGSSNLVNWPGRSLPATPLGPSTTDWPNGLLSRPPGGWTAGPPSPFGPQPSSNGRTDALQEVIYRTASWNYDNSQHRAFMDSLDVDPQKSEEEIKELLSNIRPDEDIPADQREGTPDALRYPLYPHQQLALQWMKSMEEGATKGGILADDMGLGKTVSTMSLMVSRPSDDRTNKTNLIIAPLSLIRQWESEIKNKLKPAHRMSVFVLHGKKPTFDDIRKYDVVLTTYGKVAREWSRQADYVKTHPGQDPTNSPELAKSCPILHGKSKWYRVILDEAQCIKNKDTNNSKAAHQVVATYRWCLTGTPMMNSVTDLYPLFQFLRVKRYSDLKIFNADFGCLGPNKRDGPVRRENALQKLRAVLKATMLRRMKDSKLDGKPILNLPPKYEEVVHVLFSEDETSFYQTLEAQSRVEFNKYLRANTIGKNYSHILVLLLRLRQACCHPHLHDDFDTVGVETSTEDMMKLAKAMQPNVVARIKAAEAFECPICFDADLNPVFVLPCGHNTCSACLQQLEMNATQNNIRDGRDGDNRRITMACVQCRTIVDLKQVVDYDTFIRTHMPEKAAERDLDIEESGSDDEEDASDDADENGNLRGFVVADDDDDADSVDSYLDGSFAQKLDRLLGRSNNPGQPKQSEHKEARKQKKSKGKKKVEEVKPHMLKTLRKESRKNKDARRRYMHYLRDNWEPSAKVSKACEIVLNLSHTDEKVIIFSVFTGLLDLIEVQIKYHLRIPYCRYDGSMSATQRNEAAGTFTDDPQMKVMLVSLKAGNAGLNLTAASQVIIMDPFWNPFVEMQAVDRAHRIGQKRPVKVHRLLVEGTVEDKIVRLQEQKRELVNAALDEGASKNLGRLSTQELRWIFGVSS